MALPLPPVAVPEHWTGGEALHWLLRCRAGAGPDGRWVYASAGALRALDDTAMNVDVARRLRLGPAAQVTGIVAWAAAATGEAGPVEAVVREWLLAHQGDVTRFMDRIGDPGHPPRPYGPVTVDQAAVLLAEALTVPGAADTAQSDTVAMVRSVDVGVNGVRLTGHDPGCEQVLGDVMFLGHARWESEPRVRGLAGGWVPGRGEHHLALYLRAPGAPGAAEAAVTELEPSQVGNAPWDRAGAELVVGHAAAVLAAGGVEAVVGKVHYWSPWRRQPGWDWDRLERADNMEALRRAVLAGAGWWLGYRRDRALLEAFLADLHEAAGAERQVVVVRDWEVFETAGRSDTADALWFPLLDFSPDILGFFGPRSGQGAQRLGDWILTYGELTIHGALPLPPPLASPHLVALTPGAAHRAARPGPDASAGL
ncbi:MAG: hypothetical protein M3083_08715 [Actinomycetota bacterium]|nr:hypothetical protein [Actinomycetota bacterium]